MSTVNNKHSFWGPLVLIILLIGIFTGGVTLHFLNRNLNSAITKKEQQLIQLQQEIKAYQSERTGKQLIKSEHKRLIGFIPSRENQEEFIWELGKLAQESGLKITNCLFDPKLRTLKRLPKYQALQCQVSLTGSYQNLLMFIDSLPRIARLVLISQINLKMITGANHTEPPQYEASLTLDLIASATSVAFSQPSNPNLTPSAQVNASSLKTPPSMKAPPSSRQPTVRTRFSKTAPSASPSPATKKPTTIPGANSTNRDSSPLEVKIPPIINPGE